MSGFRYLGETELHRGAVVRLCSAEFVGPDGVRFERQVVRHPGAVSVVPVRDDGTVVLVRQYRAPLDQYVLEIPAGKRDVADEPPEVSARRELVEEVGLEAGSLEFLVRFHNSIGFTDEESLVYLARDLTDVPSDRQGIEEAHMEVVEVPLDRAPEMIAAGEITDAKTVIGLTFAATRLG